MVWELQAPPKKEALKLLVIVGIGLNQSIFEHVLN